MLALGVGALFMFTFVATRQAVRVTAAERVQRRSGAARQGSALAASIDRLRTAAWLPGPIRLRVERAAPSGAHGVIAVGLVAAPVVCGVAGVARGGWVLGVVGIGLGIVMPGVALVLFRRRQDAAIEAALPEVLEAVGRSIRSGASLPQALVEAYDTVGGPVRADLHRLNESIRLGRPHHEAFDSWIAARPFGSVRLAVAALLFGAETGGGSSRAVDGLAASLRDRAALAREVTALASQARLSGLVIAVLPIGFLALSGASDDRVTHFLFSTGLGRLCLLAGLVLDGIGLLWMHHLTASIK